jgi:hypothetical protein
LYYKSFESECEIFLTKYDNGEIGLPTNDIQYEDFNGNITVEEIYAGIDKLKSKKSPGIDPIPAECIKLCSHKIVNDLELLYNYVLAEGIYPDKWCEGPRTDGEFRPITIEPIFGTFFEIIIDQRLSFINKAFNRLDLYNGGFVKGSRVQDNMFIILGCIQKQQLQGKPLYLAFVDFRKAFNFVNRTLLFFKIIKSGIHGRVINVLRNMYSKTKARVKINEFLYQWIEDTCGTNQGGPMSPNMFRKMLHYLKAYLDLQHGIVIEEDEIIAHIYGQMTSSCTLTRPKVYRNNLMVLKGFAQNINY